MRSPRRRTTEPRLRTRERLRAWVAGADDAALERVAGTAAGQRMALRAVRRAFVPAAAEGLAAEVGVELRTAGDDLSWALRIERGRLRTRGGRAVAPDLVVRLGLADAVRIAAGALDPGTALLTGRLDLEGDAVLASRLGPVLGRERL